MPESAGKAHWDKVKALEEMGPEGIPELLDALDDEKECWHTKVAAIRSLVRHGHTEGGPVILKTLARAEDPDLREVAIEALGELRVERAVRVLERIEANEPALAEAARTALGRIRHAPYR